jgi:transposase
MCYWVGNDISKDWIDCEVLGELTCHRRRFKNDPRGIDQLIKWSQSFGLVLALGMESTGGYELDLAVAAHLAGLPVSVENPRPIKDFARAMGFLNKTDVADAHAIAEFLRRIGPSPWRLADPVVRELSQLTRHRVFLLGELNRVCNRLEHKGSLPELVVEQLLALRVSLGGLISQVEQDRLRLVETGDTLQRDYQALIGIVGVGQTTAILVLSEAGDVEQFNDASTYASCRSGLNPTRRESGKWQGRSRISKQGSKLLRSGLFLAASVGSRYNPVLKAFKERLLAAGKTKMQALVACMRKLLMLCYGVLKAVRAGKEPYYGQKPLKGLTS